MFLCMIIWPVQLHLAFSPGTTFFFRSEPRDVHIECETMDGANLFSYTGEEYGWLNKTYDVEENHIRAISTSDDKVVIRRVFRKKSAEAFTGGIVDPIKYTRIHITFEIEDMSMLDDAVKFSELKSWVESVVQKFVDMYRLVSQEVDLTRPQMDDAPAIDVWVADKYKFNASGSDVTFRIHNRRLNWTNTSKTIHFKQDMSEENFKGLVGLLHSGEDVRLYDRLLLDSKEQSFVRGDHDLAIVIAETAFEAFLQSRLISWCATNSQTTLKVGRGKGEKDLPYQEAIESAQVRDNLDYVQTLTNKNIKGGAEHSNWLKYAYQARNKIIHRGIRGATHDDAGKAFTSVIAFRQLIDRTLK